MREIFNRHDPMGLIVDGAPADEYDNEIGTVVPRLRSAAGPDAVQRILVEEFTTWFGDAGPAERYAALAGDVWEAWCRSGLTGTGPATR